MVNQRWEASPRLKARAAGVFYLLSVLTAIFAETFIRGRLLYAVGLIPVLCFAAVTLLFYDIFKTVNRGVALLAAVFNLAGLLFEALELHPLHVNAALAFHGLYCLLIGYLVFRSMLVSRIFGVLMALAGLAWLLTSLPHLARSLHSDTQALGFLGEAPLMLWLLMFGVNVQRRKGNENQPAPQRSHSV